MERWLMKQGMSLEKPIQKMCEICGIKFYGSEDNCADCVFEMKRKNKNSGDNFSYAVVFFSILTIVVILFFIDIGLKTIAFRDRMGSF